MKNTAQNNQQQKIDNKKKYTTSLAVNRENGLCQWSRTPPVLGIGMKSDETSTMFTIKKGLKTTTGLRHKSFIEKNKLNKLEDKKKIRGRKKMKN